MMRSMRVGRWLIFIFALLATTVGTGAPEAVAQGNVAKRQFRDAKKLYDKEEYQDALQMFQLAWEQSYSPNARLYIGRCFVKLGNLRTGYDELRATLREAHTRAKEDKKYLNTRNAAAAELALLEPRLGRLIVLLDDRVEGATVMLDGKPLPAGKLEEAMTFEPKTVALVASAEGRDDVKRSVNIEGGKTTAVALLFPPVAGAAAGGDDKSGSGATAGQGDDGYNILQYLGFAAIGLGGATLVLAAASGAAAASRQAALDQACGGTRCTDPAFGDVVDTGKQFETLAYIGLGVGAAVALGGVALVLFGGESEDGEGADSAEPTEQSAAVLPLPGGAAFSYQLRF
jgi:hypothetical protein